MSSIVQKKTVKRAVDFEAQLLAADRIEPVTKRPKITDKKAVDSAKPLSQPEESTSSSNEGYYDPTCGRRTGHTFAYVGKASSNGPQTSGPSEDRLENKPIEELERLFSTNAELRRTKDDVWKGLAQRHLSIKLEKKDDESYYGFYKRSKLAQEEKLASLTSRIEAKRQKLLEEETKTARCALIIPANSKKRLIRSGMGQAAIVPIPSPLEVVRARSEVANGNRAALNALPQNVKGVRKPDFTAKTKPKMKTTAPLMKKTLRMMRR